MIPRNHPADAAPRATDPSSTARALDRRRADIAELADVATDLAAVDQRAAELNQRIAELLDLAIPP